MSRLSRRRPLIGVVAALCTAGLAVAPAVPSSGGTRTADRTTLASVSVPARAAACAEVLLVGARGSGEGASSTGPRPGATVRTVRDTYVAAAGAAGRSVQEAYVDLAAPSVSRLHLTGHPARPATTQVTKRTVRAWSSGVPAGVDRVSAFLTSQAVRCPDQSIVLVGYGQGAMVLHRALVRLHGNGLVRRVVGAVLIGDGDRRSSSRAAHTTGAPAAPVSGSGVQQHYLTAVGDVPTTDRRLPVWNVCTRGDLACDTRGVRLDAAVAAHRGYTRGTAADRLHAIARTLWTRTTDVPVPTPRSQSLTLHAGDAVDLQLAASVRASSASYLSWRRVGALPPGLTLGADGHLAGVLSQQGSWTLTYEVRNSRDATFPTTSRGTVTVTAAAAGATTVSAGGGQTCSTLTDGAATCWGANGFGELGDGSGTRRLTPVPVQSADGWASVSTGGSTSCGIKVDGSLWCWGLNHKGQVGDGTRTKRLAPVRIGADRAWAAVSTSWFHTCAVSTTGTLWCWGMNSSGELGDGTTTLRTRPVQVGTRTDWAGVETGGWHTCAVRTDGSLWCWGGNAFGQLGDGTTTRRLAPVRIGTGTDWTRLTASWLSTCGIEAGGHLSCWGGNDRGQLGDGSVLNRYRPTPVLTGSVVTSVSTGEAHTCAVTDVGAVWCWGDNAYGQLGTGSTTSSPTPVQVGTDTDWATVAVSWFHTCAVRTSGDLWCWGDNATGKIGDGTTTTRLSPVPVATPTPAG